MTTAISHRRFRVTFSLRTLLVAMTLSCLCLGWVKSALNWINDRQDVLVKKVASAKGYVTAPGGLWILGERGCRVISLPEASPLSYEEAIELFPEASIEPDDHAPVLQRWQEYQRRKSWF